MRPITRRNFINIAGAGILAGTAPRELQAQGNLSQVPAETGDKNNQVLLPDLTHISTKVADATEDFAEDYLWLDDHTLLFLRLTPKKKGIFHAVLVDTTTGRKTLPEPFNAKNSALLLGQSFGFGVEGSKHWDYDYAPPKVTLSPDKQWLLWPTTIENPDFQWVAADFDGKQQIWKQMADPKSEIKHGGNEGYWLRDNTGWVELVQKYAKRRYTLTRANIYHLGNPAPVRAIDIEGLADGLKVGMTQEGRVMMYHPPDNQESITNAIFSLVSLEGKAVKAERVSMPIPKTSNVWQVTLSPQGDRLVWILDEVKGDSSQTVIYVSNLDGKALRAIGAAPSVEIKPGHYSSPANARWLPDGSRLSYRYNKEIYVVAL